MKTLDPPSTLQQAGATLGGAGLLTGFVLALGVMSGDEQGRVNLLYLLTLFAFIPVLGLVLSVVFMLRASSRGLSGWVLELPLWPRRFRREVLALGSVRSRKFWLFYQTQLLALGFGVGGLLAFVLLLLGSDISFVWRSTVLEATDLFPLLHILSMPWMFWADAQPQMELLQHSQDFRLESPQYTAVELGQWWKYAFAAQCSYNLFPRTLLLVIAYTRLTYSQRSDREIVVDSAIVPTHLNRVPELGNLAPLLDSVPDNFVLLNWADLSESLLENLQKSLGMPQKRLAAGPLLVPDGELFASSCVIVVKAWEPPMGELGDYMTAINTEANKPGLLLPLDWDEGRFIPVSEANIMEWRRFCGSLINWSVLNPLKVAPQPEQKASQPVKEMPQPEQRVPQPGKGVPQQGKGEPS